MAKITLNAKCTSINSWPYAKKVERSYSFTHGSETSDTSATFCFREFIKPGDKAKFEIDKEYTISIEQ